MLESPLAIEQVGKNIKNIVVLRILVNFKQPCLGVKILKPTEFFKSASLLALTL